MVTFRDPLPERDIKDHYVAAVPYIRFGPVVVAAPQPRSGFCRGFCRQAGGIEQVGMLQCHGEAIFVVVALPVLVLRVVAVSVIVYCQC